MKRANRPDGLQAELAALQREQRYALQNATYIGMTPQEQRDYDFRAHRITELQRALALEPEA